MDPYSFTYQIALGRGLTVAETELFETIAHEIGPNQVFDFTFRRTSFDRLVVERLRAQLDMDPELALKRETINLLLSLREKFFVTPGAPSVTTTRDLPIDAIVRLSGPDGVWVEGVVLGQSRDSFEVMYPPHPDLPRRLKEGDSVTVAFLASASDAVLTFQTTVARRTEDMVLSYSLAHSDSAASVQMRKDVRVRKSISVTYAPRDAMNEPAAFLEGQILDIALGGMRMRTAGELPAQSAVGIRMPPIPPHYPKGQLICGLVVRVSRVDEVDGQPFFDHHIKLDSEEAPPWSLVLSLFDQM
ncbi:MAG: hypothetical protein ACREJ2_00395 [Planctomycetota bacterium]